MFVFGLLICTFADAQNKVVVVPMIEQEVLFTGVGRTGNTVCSVFANPPGNWVTVSLCSNLDVTIRGQDAFYTAGADASPRFTINGNGSTCKLVRCAQSNLRVEYTRDHGW